MLRCVMCAAGVHEECNPVTEFCSCACGLGMPGDTTTYRWPPKQIVSSDDDSESREGDDHG